MRVLMAVAEVEAAAHQGRIIEQKGGCEVTAAGNRHRGVVERADALDQPVGGRSESEIALGDDDPVRQCHLLFRFGHSLEIALTVDGVDNRDQRLQMKFTAKTAVGGKGLQYRTGVGEPGSLDN